MLLCQFLQRKSYSRHFIVDILVAAMRKQAEEFIATIEKEI